MVLLYVEMYCYSIYVGMCSMNLYYTTKISSVTYKDLVVRMSYIKIVDAFQLLNITSVQCIP